MKKSLLGLAVFAVCSLNFMNSAFADQTFNMLEVGNCGKVQQHAEEKALGNCLWAQYESCQIVSSVELSDDGFNHCQWHVTVDGSALNRDANQNRIFKQDVNGDCGQSLIDSKNGALARCYSAGMRSCTSILSVTVSDNGQDYCQTYGLARGSNE